MAFFSKYITKSGLSSTYRTRAYAHISDSFLHTLHSHVSCIYHAHIGLALLLRTSDLRKVLHILDSCFSCIYQTHIYLAHIRLALLLHISDTHFFCTYQTRASFAHIKFMLILHILDLILPHQSAGISVILERVAIKQTNLKVAAQNSEVSWIQVKGVMHLKLLNIVVMKER